MGAVDHRQTLTSCCAGRSKARAALCDIGDPLRDKYAGLARAKIERGGMPQGGGFGVEDGGTSARGLLSPADFQDRRKASDRERRPDPIPLSIMAVIGTDQIEPKFWDGSCEKSALLALKNVFAGDTADIGGHFRVIKRAGIVCDAKGAAGTQAVLRCAAGTLCHVQVGPRQCSTGLVHGAGWIAGR